MRLHVASTVRSAGGAHEMLELGEDLLDGIEIGTVGRQEEEPGSGGTDGTANGLAFVATEVVEDSP